MDLRLRVRRGRRALADRRCRREGGGLLPGGSSPAAANATATFTAITGLGLGSHAYRGHRRGLLDLRTRSLGTAATVWNLLRVHVLNAPVRALRTSPLIPSPRPCQTPLQRRQPTPNPDGSTPAGSLDRGKGESTP